MGNYDEEKYILMEIIRYFAKEDKYNEIYWKIADLLYYDYVNTHIKSYSEKTHRELTDKSISEILKKETK